MFNATFPPVQTNKTFSGFGQQQKPNVQFNLPNIQTGNGFTFPGTTPSTYNFMNITPTIPSAFTTPSIYQGQTYNFTTPQTPQLSFTLLTDENLKNTLVDGFLAKIEHLGSMPGDKHHELQILLNKGPYQRYYIPEAVVSTFKYNPVEKACLENIGITTELSSTVTATAISVLTMKTTPADNLDRARRIVYGWLQVLRVITSTLLISGVSGTNGMNGGSWMTGMTGVGGVSGTSGTKTLALSNGFCFLIPANSDIWQPDPITAEALKFISVEYKIV